MNSSRQNSVIPLSLAEAEKEWQRFIDPSYLMPMFSYEWYHTWITIS